jgi:peptidoglycan hydrolase-like protein with peptidoglycan-binding domain
MIASNQRGLGGSHIVPRGSPFCVALLLGAWLTASHADELTQRVQNDLVALGYQPGNTSGEVTTDTTVAIAKFQAEHGLEVNGQVSPVLAGILEAEISKRSADPAAKEAARQACLQDKIAAAERAQRTRRGIGRLANAASRLASQAGNQDVTRAINSASSAVSTADDLMGAAKDLGITDDEIAACNR